jgi:hypothetical protein
MSDDDGCPHGLDERWCSICLHGPTKPQDKEERVSTCDSCEAEIIWVVTESKPNGEGGKAMPLDVEPSSEGRFIKLRVEGDKKIVRALRNSELDSNTARTYTSHFSTCPHADQHRRSR